MVKLIFQTSKVDVNCKVRWSGRTPLSLAAEKGHKAVFQLLLEIDKVEIDSEDDSGQKPLSWAAKGGHDDVVKLLLETDKAKVESDDK